MKQAETSPTDDPGPAGEVDFATLHAAVTLAKDRRITTRAALLDALLSAGFPESDCRSAIAFWSQYEAGKVQPSARA